jgi:hypothetical protein
MSVINIRRARDYNTTSLVVDFGAWNEAMTILNVVRKPNRSAPKDSVWINNGTIRCQSAGDLYLLLKVSDFCSYDAQHAPISWLATRIAKSFRQ